MAAEYTTPLRMTVESRAELDRFLFQLMNTAQRRVTISEAIRVACVVATAHLPEVVDALNPTAPDTRSE
ncbi:hypothetical protein [Streptomyces sp. NBC_00280]|uniref:hypothetical protein n=1 Tax=Streptomyces sp. NBC_00280 TaxID=2975699 RepID=UPI003253CABD